MLWHRYGRILLCNLVDAIVYPCIYFKKYIPYILIWKGREAAIKWAQLFWYFDVYLATFVQNSKTTSLFNVTQCDSTYLLSQCLPDILYTKTKCGAEVNRVWFSYFPFLQNVRQGERSCTKHTPCKHDSDVLESCRFLQWIWERFQYLAGNRLSKL